MSGSNNSGDKDNVHKRYLENRMTLRERNDYERHLQGDSFAEEAAEGFELISGSDLEMDLSKLKGRLDRRLRPNRMRSYLGYAAATVMILAVSTFLLVSELRKPTDILSDNYPAVGMAPDSSIREKPSEQPVINAGSLNEPVIAETKKKAEPAKMAQPAVREAEVQEDVINVDEIMIAEASERTIPAQAIRLPDESPAKSASAAARKKEMETEQIRGVVVSSVDGEPIAGVSITLAGKTSGVLTDREGRFAIAGDANSVINARFIGMSSVDIPANQVLVEKIVMDPDVLGLEEVVITSAGIRKKDLSSSGSVTVIDMTKNDNPSGYISAEPEGGFNLFRDYVSENSVFPVEYINSDREVVRLKFHVNRSGIISDIEIIRTPGPDFSKEAIRLLKNGPQWRPASRDGLPVSGNVTIRIVFQR